MSESIIMKYPTDCAGNPMQVGAVYIHQKPRQGTRFLRLVKVTLRVRGPLLCDAEHQSSEAIAKAAVGGDNTFSCMFREVFMKDGDLQERGSRFRVTRVNQLLEANPSALVHMLKLHGRVL